MILLNKLFKSQIVRGYPAGQKLSGVLTVSDDDDSYPYEYSNGSAYNQYNDYDGCGGCGLSIASNINWANVFGNNRRNTAKWGLLGDVNFSSLLSSGLGSSQFGGGLYGSSQYGSSQYGNNQFGGSQYGGSQYGSSYGNSRSNLGGFASIASKINWSNVFGSNKRDSRGWGLEGNLGFGVNNGFDMSQYNRNSQNSYSSNSYDYYGGGSSQGRFGGSARRSSSDVLGFFNSFFKNEGKKICG